MLPLTRVPSRNESGTGSVASRAYRILVADDHVIVRHGLRALLESQRGVEVCGEASNGPEAIEFVKKSRPDLVVLDLMMPDMDGLKVTSAIREVSPETEVLVFTIHFSEELAHAVRTAGALGYVLKRFGITRCVGPHAPPPTVLHELLAQPSPDSDNVTFVQRPT